MSSLSRILVATDFSACGSAAVVRAAQLAEEHGAELRLVHASPDWSLFSRSLPAQQSHYGSLTQHAEAAMQREVESVRKKFSVTARGDVHLGTATQAILRLSEEFQPQLVVVGARGEHGRLVAPAALGGTALKLLAQTTRTMLIVREPDSARYRESLLAIEDSSELSARIVEWGIRLAPTAVCHLVHAYEVPYLERLRQCGLDEDSLRACASTCRQAAEVRVDAVLRRVDGSARIHKHLVPGEPLSVVLTEIVCDRVQLLVVGKHVHQVTEPEHALVGSVGLRLVYHAPTDVLVVP